MPGEDHVDTVARYIYSIVSNFGDLEEKTVYDLLRVNNQRMFEAYKRRVAAMGIAVENGMLSYGMRHKSGHVYETVPAMDRKRPYYQNMIHYVAFMVRREQDSLFSFTDAVQPPFYLKMVRSSQERGAMTSYLVDLITSGHSFSDYKQYIEDSYEINHSAQLNQVGRFADDTHKTRIVLIMESTKGAERVKTTAEVAVAVPIKDKNGVVSFKGYDAKWKGI